MLAGVRVGRNGMVGARDARDERRARPYHVNVGIPAEVDPDQAERPARGLQ